MWLVKNVLHKILRGGVITRGFVQNHMPSYKRFIIGIIFISMVLNFIPYLYERKSEVHATTEPAIPYKMFVTVNDLVSLSASINGGDGLLSSGGDTDVILSLNVNDPDTNYYIMGTTDNIIMIMAKRSNTRLPICTDYTDLI